MLSKSKQFSFIKYWIQYKVPWQKQSLQTHRALSETNVHLLEFWKLPSTDEINSVVTSQQHAGPSLYTFAQ